MGDGLGVIWLLIAVRADLKLISTKAVLVFIEVYLRCGGGVVQRD